MTHIIATLGPASEDFGTLQYFVENSVEYARLNTSHGTYDWHLKAGKRAKDVGLKLLLDLSGPKIRLGDLEHEVEVAENDLIALEKQIPEKTYPTWQAVDRGEALVLPCYLDLAQFLHPNRQMLIDDGKVELKVTEISTEQILAKVEVGGKIKSHKGINLPHTEIKIDFLTEKDKATLRTLLPKLKPEIVAASFVKTEQDLKVLQTYIENVLQQNEITNYRPQICTKVEMHEAVEEINLQKIVETSDIVMIARGDLALETTPVHIRVPFLQEKIKNICKEKNKPFTVATQILESMTGSPVPTRAEMSDLYRAIVIDGANFVMLSAESATGAYAKRCVRLMHEMIKLAQQ